MKWLMRNVHCVYSTVHCVYSTVHCVYSSAHCLLSALESGQQIYYLRYVGFCTASQWTIVGGGHQRGLCSVLCHASVTIAQ